MVLFVIYPFLKAEREIKQRDRVWGKKEVKSLAKKDPRRIIGFKSCLEECRVDERNLRCYKQCLKIKPPLTSGKKYSLVRKWSYLAKNIFFFLFLSGEEDKKKRLTVGP